MGQETSRASQENGPVGLTVDRRWVEERLRSTRALLVFRMTMVRLQRENPEAFQLVETIRRAVDMDHRLMYDSYSQINSSTATKDNSMKGD